MRVTIEHDNDIQKKVINRGMWRTQLVREVTRYTVTYDVRLTNVERYVLNSSGLWQVVVYKFFNDSMADENGLIRYPKEMTEQQFIEENTLECTVRDAIDGHLIRFKTFESALEAKLWEKTLREEIFQGITNLVNNNRPKRRSETFRL